MSDTITERSPRELPKPNALVAYAFRVAEGNRPRNWSQGCVLSCALFLRYALYLVRDTWGVIEIFVEVSFLQAACSTFWGYTTWDYYAGPQ